MINAFGLITSSSIFAEEAAPSGIGALGLNVKYFLFQLISFVIILLILRRWVFPKLVATLEDRRLAVEQSLNQAKETEAAMRKAEKQVAAILHEAQTQASDIVDSAKKEATKTIEAAEGKAIKQAEHIISEAKAQMNSELSKARVALKQETTKLVALATEQIVQEKVDSAKNSQLISKAIASAEKESANG